MGIFNVCHVVFTSQYFQDGPSIPQCVPKFCSLPPLPIPSAVSHPKHSEFINGESGIYGCENGDADIVWICRALSLEFAGGSDAFYMCANSCGPPQRQVNGFCRGM